MTVVTQNVDSLHLAAGSAALIELNGHLRDVVCLACSAVQARTAFQDELRALNPGWARLEALPTAAGDAEANKEEDKKFHEMADNFLGFMMKNFETELTVMGARIALTTYDLPFLPTKLKNFDEFHKRFGKYVLSAMES